MTGDVILDRRQAVAIAQRMATKLEQGHNRRMNEALFGVNPNRTLGQLLAQLHRAKESTWSEQYRRDQDRYRAFWTDKLGADLRIVAMNAAMVEGVASREATERDWSPRTHGAYLRYIVDATYYAERKLKWIEPRHNLSAVDIPSPDSKGLPYSEDEVRRLLNALDRIGDVPGWAGRVLWQTGRRRHAVFSLPKSAVSVEDERAVIRWPKATDKARKGGVSVIVGRALELTRKLMDEPGRYVVGEKPPTEAHRREWILAAEEIAGIEHQPYRAWHGIKRRWSNRTDGMKSRAAQAGTLEDTLRRVYDPGDDLDAAEAVARKLASEVD